MPRLPLAAGLLLLAFTLALFPGGPARADAPRFGLPIDCRVGEACFVQNYVDEDPGPGWRDHACGTLSYDGHDGTDIRLPDYVMMDRGVAVLAAAAGTVLRVRDGMEDVNVDIIGRAAVMDRGAGNAVILDHGDGWQTAYLHMRKGSVAVRPGQRVEAGQRLGLVGLSGLTEFPHVHFGVRHDGRVVDPFVGETPFAGCGPAAVAGYAPLWTDEAAKALAYRATAGLGAGFADQLVKAEEARHGAGRLDALPADAPLLVLWSDIMGVKAGDRQRVRIEAADGTALIDNTVDLTADKAVWFAYQGVRRSAAGWPPGPYRGTVTLTRAGQTVVTLERRLEGAGGR